MPVSASIILAVYFGPEKKKRKKDAGFISLAASTSQFFWANKAVSHTRIRPPEFDRPAAAYRSVITGVIGPRQEGSPCQIVT